MSSNLTPFSCGLEAALAVVGGKWKCIILWHLSKGHKRYAELRRHIGDISEKMLVQELKALETDGIIARKDFKEKSPHVEYTLTKFGSALYNSLKPLCKWGWRHKERIAQLPRQKTTIKKAS